ncbi:biotin--[acetyl-CoA-carboxylase] ligase [Kineosporiaceae bacterium SCSIO 59966]|nr:biotin--[acetyl-CoA-carboxylase] ligase [Kineosporiaceae bacterium SCSIO 59966]
MGTPWGDLDRPPLRADALRAALLAPSGPFARLDVVARTGSTNADLLAAAAADPAGYPDLSVLATDHQVAGRGRLARSWQAPERSSVEVSVLLRPDVPARRWSWLPLLAGTAVAAATRRVAGVRAGVKWPNDVLVEVPDAEQDAGADAAGKVAEPAAGKVAGVLAEAVPGQGALVVGIGLNVTQTRAELPVPTATSLRLAGAATTDRDTVLRAVLRAVADRYARWVAADGDVTASGLAAEVRESCWTLGRAVRVVLPAGEVVGTAEELDDDGRLVVRDAAGERHALSAGDVVHAGVGT